MSWESESYADYAWRTWRDVYGRFHWRQDPLSDELFKCRRCAEIVDKDMKNSITISKFSTKASAKASLCDKCFTNFVNTVDFKFGDWKDWPKRSKD